MLVLPFRFDFYCVCLKLSQTSTKKKWHWLPVYTSWVTLELNGFVNDLQNIDTTQGILDVARLLGIPLFINCLVKLVKSVVESKKI